MTEGLDPVSMLTDDAMVAQWNNEGLPGDKMSTQNATILTNCQPWLLIYYIIIIVIIAGYIHCVVPGLLNNMFKICTCVLLQVSAGLSSLTLSCKASSGSRVDVEAASRLSVLDREGEFFKSSGRITGLQ